MGKMKSVSYAMMSGGAVTTVSKVAKVAKVSKPIPPAPVYSVAHLPLLDPETLAPTTLMRTLYQACSLRRADGSITEAMFVAWLCNRLPVTMVDGAGNIHVDRRTEPNHRTMFTSHTDSVHSVRGGANTIRVEGDMWRADGAALGADDGAGIALMMHMMENNVPGYYIFFRGEECGGVGSQWLADNLSHVLTDIDRAVAFDRAGYHDVITHQGFNGRCCSDAFAQALADQLSVDDMSVVFTPCPDGVFTDTANLVDFVPECTNLSVGYKNQHGDREWQDVAFLQLLAERVVAVQWDELPVERDPNAIPDDGPGRAPRWATTTTYAAPTRPSSALVKTDYPQYPQYSSPDSDDWGAIAALEEALDGDFVTLLDMMAERMYPQDPCQARKWLSVRKIGVKDLEMWLLALQDGSAVADQALDDMIELAQVT